jgi:hypothetical protein
MCKLTFYVYDWGVHAKLQTKHIKNNKKVRFYRLIFDFVFKPSGMRRFRGCLIMLVNDRAEIFQTDLFLWRRSIAGYATEAKG